jgi:hypothetical protein
MAWIHKEEGAEHVLGPFFFLIRWVMPVSLQLR